MEINFEPRGADAKFFTKLDAKSGYWTCELTHHHPYLQHLKPFKVTF